MMGFTGKNVFVPGGSRGIGRAIAHGFVDADMAARYLDTPRGDEIRNQSPLGRVAKPEEVALAVIFLAAEGTEFMTGAIIDVNGASYLRT